MPTRNSSDDLSQRSRIASPSPRDFARMAWHPSRYAPPLRRVHQPPFVPTGLPLLEMCSARDVVLRDGVVESLSLSGRAFICYGERLFQTWPIRCVRMVAVQPFVAEVAGCPHLERVARLDLVGNQIGPEGLRHLLGSRHARFEGLNLANNALTAESLCELMTWGGFASLRELDWSWNSPSAEAMIGLTRAEQLKWLALSGNPFDAASLTSLPRSLRSLAISDCGLGEVDLQQYSSLKHLDLSHNPRGPGHHSLPKSLTHLDLSFDELDSPFELPPNLQVLRLRGNRFHRLDTPLPATLETLDLASNPLGDEGVRHLVAQPRPANLKHLDLTNVGLTSAGLDTLRASGWFEGLEQLSLAWNPCADRVGS